MKSIRKSEDGVSPVIGVMLMLVVTLIIAAVIGTFGSGVIGTTDSVPSASIKISDYHIDVSSAGGQINSVTFKHMSGDSLNLNDLVFETQWDYAVHRHADIPNNNEWLLLDTNENSLWDVGEHLIYTDKLSEFAGFANYAILMSGAEIVNIRISTTSGKTISELEFQVK